MFQSYSKRTLTRKIALIALPLAFTLSSLPSHAGAWVAQKGSAYNKVGVSDYSASDFFGGNPDLGEFEGTSVSYYGELGLGNNWGVFTSVLYQDITQSDSSGRVTQNDGLGDLDIGVKYQWQAEPFVLSTQLLAKLPYLYDEDEALPLGNGQEDIEAKVLVGKSLGRLGYFGLELGYRFRADDPSDEIRYLIEYGVSLSDNFYLRAKLDGIESANNADDQFSGTGNLSRTLEFDVGKLELTAGWNFGQPSDGGRWGAEFTYTDDLFGDNSLRGDGFQFAVTRSF